MGEFKMPSLGADMEAGTLVAWKVKPGDRVTRGDLLAEIEVDKGLVEVESFENGVIERLLVEPGGRFPVGTVLATIREEQEAPSTGPSSAPPAPDPPLEKRLHISPLARKRASELGIDPSTVQGSGPGGAIERADIESAATAKAPTIATETLRPAPLIARATEIAPPPSTSQSRTHRATALMAARSNREIPHYHVSTRIDVSPSMRWMESENLKQRANEPIRPVAILLRAVVLALIDIPELNGFWINDQHELSSAVHLGLAISRRDGGLVVPTIRDANLKSPGELMHDVDTLIPRARAGHLRTSEMGKPTVTVLCLADMNVETVFGLVYPPQVALVSLGRIGDQPWAENGMLGVRPILHATLSGDHRATDCHRGGQLLEALASHLQHPEKF